MENSKNIFILTGSVPKTKPAREHEKERDPASCEAGTVDVCVNDYE